MNRSAIKNFATWARRTLREQVTARAAQYGISRDRIIEPQVVAGGLLVAGQTLDAEEAKQYEQLREHLKDLMRTSRQPQAVDALIDEIAYTWFNRLAALRFMEVNGYIGRVLSSSDPNLVDPDLLREASSIAEMGDLPGLDLPTLDEWRSFANRDPNPDEYLYRRLLIAQCSALAGGIPALFDPRKNYQALFLPANLLNQDSIVQRLVKEVPEEDWQDIEVVGWLYQFYISERKDEVIGAKSKVAAADIPAATQLFTPHYALEQSESLFREYVPALRGLVLQAELLRKQYWVVVANPPYMGGNNMNSIIKEFAKKYHPYGKSDVFAMFVERIDRLAFSGSLIGLLTPFVWMFLLTYENLRSTILDDFTIVSLIQLEYNAFEPACVPVCTLTIRKGSKKHEFATFIRLSDFKGYQNQAPKTLEAIKNPYKCDYLFYSNSEDFKKIPGKPIAYWVSSKIKEIFVRLSPLSTTAILKQGLSTTDNNRFLRYWNEVKIQNIGFGCLDTVDAKKSGCKWFPFNKGGNYRKWFGNNDYIIDWKNDGKTIKAVGGVARNTQFYFKKGITWSSVSSSELSMRVHDVGFIFSDVGQVVFPDNYNQYNILLSFLNSSIACYLLKILSPTLHFHSGYIAKLPINLKNDFKINIKNIILLSRRDWNFFETSWGFQIQPLFLSSTKRISEAFKSWQQKSENYWKELKHLEEENNRFWIEAYGLQDELTPEVPDEQITIRRADLERDIRSLISYAVGCMMGRYSLDEPGLIHAGQPFDPTLHKTFPADADAIIPITDKAYFEDDIVTRFVEFLRVAYSPETLNENLDFIANALKLRSGESALDRIRRYFVQEFISDHIQTYKKRPIYWLFTSGKKRAFGALVYLHRYDEGTLARIRMDYVLELQVKLDGEIARTRQQLDDASSSVAKKAATKRLKELQEQQLELRDYQAKLQNLADARIQLDLDDGVAYNYTRFKGLVYEGADLKMADLEKASQWKLELLKQADKA